jgi:hypothetical protein
MSGQILPAATDGVSARGNSKRKAVLEPIREPTESQIFVGVAMPIELAQVFVVFAFAIAVALAVAG